MNTQFSTITLLSFYQWLDNQILQKGQAYQNNTSRLFYQPDSTLGSSKVAYAAPFKSWVWDSGVSGAAILTSVSGSLNMSRGTGMIVDYENGRVIFDASVGSKAIISGSYAFKDFNVYFANQTDERMIFSNKYYLNSRFNNSATPTGAVPIQWNERLKAYNMVTPCIFVSNVHTKNPGWAFGGLYNTTTTIVLNVLAETQGQLQGAMSLLTDCQDMVFPQLGTHQWPLNAFGDWKGGTGYNYQTIKTLHGQPGNLFTITDVQASAISDYTKIDESVFGAVIALTVEKPRTLR